KACHLSIGKIFARQWGCFNFNICILLFKLLSPVAWLFSSKILYTLEVITKAENYNNSEPVVGLAETLKRQLPAPDNQGIKLTATTSIVTVILRGYCDGHIACICLPTALLLY
ncbi:MAG: hypothetical protein ACNYNY_03330, partial [Candidatus Oxydemutatoraceae bacterium WSBS_2016_MAG_OTU14]